MSHKKYAGRKTCVQLRCKVCGDRTAKYCKGCSDGNDSVVALCVGKNGKECWSKYHDDKL